MAGIRAQAASARMGALDRMDRADWLTAAVLHERYLEDVFRYVLRRVPRWEEAQDITAQVFAAAVAEIAVVMGRSATSVKGLLQRARAALQRRGRSYFLGDEDTNDERA